MKYSGYPHYYGNLLCAVDLECTGLRPGYHEPIQIAVVPLDINYEPLNIKPFYRNIAPEFPERATDIATGVHGLDPYVLHDTAASADEVAEQLWTWMHTLDLPADRCLIPLAHNYPYESSFLKAWLGVPLMAKIFHGHYRDGMAKALDMNDQAARAGREIPFKKVGLADLCLHFQIEHHNPHDALADCYAEAQVYKSMIAYAAT
jgi:DNA polymerase III epsilon subunit-like protein